MRIGVYVHHHGAGHVRRARALAAVLVERGARVTLLGSPPGLDVALARDDDGTSFLDPAAGGTFHWVPRGHAGLRARMGAIADWVTHTAPDVMVVDVSVEVTTLVRLLGVPVVVVAQPGERHDAPHALAYDLAAAILAPWPPEADPAPRLVGHPRVHRVGGISTLDGARPAGSDVPRDGSHGVVLVGGEGFDAPHLPDVVAAAVPDLTWTVLGAGSWVSDIAGVLRSADVVVSHAGQNAVADLAAVGAPAVVVPQHRPHEEQAYLAAELDRLGLATALTLEAASRPEDVDWRAAVDVARHARDAWPLWGTEGALDRAADVVIGVGRG